MDFEWDDEKARSNLAKHGVSFDLAARVFDDPYHASLHQGLVSGENRWVTIGLVAPHILVVVHTDRSDGETEVVRIVSARKATPRERRLYEEDT